jgi:transposase
MEIREETYQQIEAALPHPRGKEVVSNRRFLEALAYRLENGCKWRKLPKEYGDWHVIYVRANR